MDQDDETDGTGVATVRLHDEPNVIYWPTDPMRERTSKISDSDHCEAKHESDHAYVSRQEPVSIRYMRAPAPDSRSRDEGAHGIALDSCRIVAGTTLPRSARPPSRRCGR